MHKDSVHLRHCYPTLHDLVLVAMYKALEVHIHTLRASDLSHLPVLSCHLATFQKVTLPPQGRGKELTLWLLVTASVDR